MAVLKILAAVLIVFLAWWLIQIILGTVLTVVFQLALVALFAGLIWAAYQVLTSKQKNRL